MPKRFAVLVVIASIAVLAVGVGFAGAATSSKVKASLNGKQESSGGATNGKGTFSATITGTKVCYSLKFSGVSGANAAHIHKGAKGKDGAVVVDLKFKSGTSAKKCVTATSAVAKAIKKHPAGYYVNVHNAKFPNGAIRGQLSAA